MSARKEQLEVMRQMAATLERIENRLADLWDLQAALAGSKQKAPRVVQHIQVRDGNDLMRKARARSGGGVSVDR